MTLLILSIFSKMLSASRFLPRFCIQRSLSLREQAQKIDPKSIYEPIIVDTRVYPEYEQLNVRLRSFDYAPLEKFQAYIDGVSRKFGFNVVDR